VEGSVVREEPPRRLARISDERFEVFLVGPVVGEGAL